VDVLEKYLHELNEIRASGEATDETSYYPPLCALLDDVGHGLKPQVRCILTIKNRGAGIPDGGLFSRDQFQKLKGGQPIPGQKPARGAIEVKSTKDDAWVIAKSDQVTKYWKEYGQVLVTNYRDFLLLGRDSDGRPVKLASYRLAENEKEFWKVASHPHKAAVTHGTRFQDFLKLVLLSPAILAAPQDVAWVLAYYAREAKARIDERHGVPALDSVRQALEQALGLKFEGDKGEHFFRSSLVQTLFYGVFSAWVLWSKQRTPKSPDRFDWRLAQWSLRVPMIRALFQQVATPGHLGELGLVEVLDWTASALNRVDRAEFFARFQEQDAVQYFYEPFLEAFDPELRKDLGVWYTPREIVQYMVARTHTVLREELGLEDGLADPNVYVLDPACGTGAYLVEVLKTIAETLKGKGDDGLIADDVKRAATERVFGFEILPAPFVISHLQLGLLLQNLGAPLKEDSAERVGVYLTNSLTGWEPPKGPKQHLIFPEMEAERDAAERIKHDEKILVIIGNPPYNAFAGVSPAEEEGLVEPYKEGLISEWGIKKFNLDDLYVRFFRLAERRIAEMTGRGVVCFISNASWITEPSFVALRRHLLNNFDAFWIENLHGNRKISEYASDGRTSETVFAIRGFSPGIQQPVATSLWVKSGKKRSPIVRFRDDVNAAQAEDRRKQLLNTLLTPDFNSRYSLAVPSNGNRYSFQPMVVSSTYLDWPRILDLSSIVPSNGLMEKRGGALVDTNVDRLRTRVEAYFDKATDWHEFESSGHPLAKRRARFDPKKARAKAITAEGFLPERIVRYAVRPFDSQWCYYTGVRPVWNEPRPSLWAQVWPGNWFLLTRLRSGKDPEGVPVYFTQLLSDDHFLSPDAVAIPVRLRVEAQDPGGTLFKSETEPSPRPNVSAAAVAYLSDTGVAQADALWTHVLAVGSSPAHLSENADGIRRDWPRIPLPASKNILLASARLGEELAALLNTEVDVRGITAGTIRPELKAMGNITPVQSKTIDPAADLEIEAGWGHAGKDNATMPGKGTLVERDYTSVERNAIAEGAELLGLTLDQALAQLGATTCDVFLNERAYWKNVPKNVWEYYIGGYQVMKKWLSYREAKLLGRSLSPDEARYVQQMARRIAAICLLQPQLDANYTAVKSNTYAWPK
jgi:Type ISP C-terminal specificity domain/N-6 DNA Methylase